MPGLWYLKVTARATQTVEAGLQDLVPGKDHGLRVIQQPGHDPGEGWKQVKSLQSASCPCPRRTGAPELASHLSAVSSRVLLGPGASRVRRNRRKGWLSCWRRLRRGLTAPPGLPSRHSTRSKSRRSSADGPPTRDRISSSGDPSWPWAPGVSSAAAQTHRRQKWEGRRVIQIGQTEKLAGAENNRRPPLFLPL